MGLLRMAARTAVVAGTATAVSGRVARRQARRYERDYGPPAEPEPAPQDQYAPDQDAPPEDDLSAKVQQLASLHSQGLLTDDEFTAAKAKALGI